MVTEILLYFAIFYFLAKWQFEAKWFILNELRFICIVSRITVSLIIIHTLRHTFATTTTLSKGVPIGTVSKMLGHTNIERSWSVPIWFASSNQSTSLQTIGYYWIECKNQQRIVVEKTQSNACSKFRQLSCWIVCIGEGCRRFWSYYRLFRKSSNSHADICSIPSLVGIL